MPEKHLCGWKDQILDNLEEFRKIVERPRFACKRCGRVAAKKRWLCKPFRLERKPAASEPEPAR